MAGKTISQLTDATDLQNFDVVPLGRGTSTLKLSGLTLASGLTGIVYNALSGNLPTVASDTTKLPLSGGTLTGGLFGTTAVFTTSVSSVALSGTHYGDGSKLTGIVTPSGLYAPLSGATLTGGLVGTTAVFTTSVSSVALSGTHYGDGSKLTGIVTGGAFLPLSGGTVLNTLAVSASYGVFQTGNYGGHDVAGDTASFFGLGKLISTFGGSMYGAASDSQNNLYVADYNNHTIRKITPTGTTSIFAGVAGLSGTADGTGSAARFCFPRGIAIDATNNLYVVDAGNYTIRKITSSGVVTTFVGTAGSQGIVDGTGSAARFYTPWGITVDSGGNLYVTEYTQHVVRKITSGGVVTTFAGLAGTGGSADGTGSAARFRNPYGIAADSSNNLFVCDGYYRTIRKITSSAVVTTFAGNTGGGGYTDGIGIFARFGAPRGIAVDSSNNLYVTDSANCNIRKITSSAVVTTFAGQTASSNVGNVDGTGTDARFTSPVAIAITPSNLLYVSDNSAIRKIDSSAVVTTFVGLFGKFGNADGLNNFRTISWQDSSTTQFRSITGSINLITDYTDPLIFSTNNTERARITETGILSAGAVSVQTFASVLSTGTLQTGIYNGHDVLNDNALFIGAGNNLTIPVAKFWSPFALVQDLSGNIYVADTSNGCVRKINAANNVTTTFATGFNGLYGITIDSSNNLYVADVFSHVIYKITSAGIVSTFAGTVNTAGYLDGTGTAAKFNNPWGIDIDSSGNLFVADSGNNVIRKITSAGVVSTFAGLSAASGYLDGTGSAARFSLLAGLTVDTTNNNIYVCDRDNSVVRKITSAGVVSTFAGLSSTPGSADGTGTAAQFFGLQGITVDSNSNVYVADSTNCTIRKITSAGVVTTIAGSVGALSFADGTGTAARFYYPSGINVDANNNLIVADTYNSVIRRVTSGGGTTTIAGTPFDGPGFSDGYGYNPYGSVGVPFRVVTWQGTPSTHIKSLTGSITLGTDYLDPLIFNTNNTERFRITETGALSAQGSYYGDASFLTTTRLSSTITSSSLTLNLATGNFFVVTLNSAITTLSITNVPGTPKVVTFTLQFVADGTARAVTWPTSVKWPGGSAPTLTSTLNKVDMFTFVSHDGGTTWYSSNVRQNM